MLFEFTSFLSHESKNMSTKNEMIETILASQTEADALWTAKELDALEDYTLEAIYTAVQAANAQRAKKQVEADREERANDVQEIRDTLDSVISHVESILRHSCLYHRPRRCDLMDLAQTKEHLNELEEALSFIV